MNSVTAINRLPQLRAIPVPGTPLFQYERMVSGRWVACNHSRAAGVVGVFNRKARKLTCRNSTVTTSIPAASKFMLSAMTGKSSRSSTGAPVIRTTACSLLNGSARNSEGWKDEH